MASAMARRRRHALSRAPDRVLAGLRPRLDPRWSRWDVKQASFTRTGSRRSRLITFAVPVFRTSFSASAQLRRAARPEVLLLRLAAARRGPARPVAGPRLGEPGRGLDLGCPLAGKAKRVPLNEVWTTCQGSRRMRVWMMLPAAPPWPPSRTCSHSGRSKASSRQLGVALGVAVHHEEHLPFEIGPVVVHWYSGATMP
jgi:hypothetical protein